MRFAATLFVLSLVIPTYLIGQLLPIKNFSIQSGLSQSVINDIIQDDGGYIWIATEYGLNRFNRFDFVNYFDSDGLTHNNVLSLLQTSDGRLLAGTERGVSEFDQQRFRTAPGFQMVRDMSVLVLFEDSNQGVWVGTNGNGLFYFRDDSFIHLSSATGLPDDIVRSVIELADGSFLVATRGGLSHIVNARVMQNITREQGLSEDRSRDLLLTPSGDIWVATRSGVDILTNFPAEVSISKLSDPDQLVYPRITSLANDNSGGIWIATESGVAHYRDQRIYAYSDNNGLSNNIVNVVRMDFENNVWFGTYGGGADLLTGEKFLHYTVQNGLQSNMITSFAQAPDGTIWAGTYGGGTARLENHVFTTYTTAQGLNDNRVYTLSFDRAGTFYVGTRSGISVYRNGRFEQASEFPDLPDPKIRSILQDSNGDFWVGTYGGGLVRYRNGRKVETFDINNGLPDNIVMKVIETQSGEIWAATYGGVIQIQNGQINVINTDDGLLQNTILTIFEDHKGRIWAGTFAGISVIENGVIRNISAMDGMQHVVSYFITEDDDGYIWVGTNNGLIRYNPDLQTVVRDPARVRDITPFKVYNAEMGLSADETNANAVLRDRDGNFWIGTVGGVNHLQWRLEQEVTVGPPVHIENIRIFDGSSTVRTDLVFRHNQNFIAFEFTGISFSGPSQVLYEYRLRGIDQTWQQTTQRTIRYTTLPAGEFRFEVRARNGDGYWSPLRSSITFRILPPFWRSWWFILLVTLLTLFTLAFIYNYYRIAKLVDVERIRIRIASDLHDDVGASLTEIALQADFLQATQKDSKVAESLRQIGEMSRRIVTTMDDIVWSIDARNDKFGDLLDRMQDYATNVLVHQDIEVTYHFTGIDSEKVMSLEIRQNLYLIFKEAVNNAAKHSRASSMEVTLRLSDGQFTMVIADNGIGLPESVRSGGHGLKNMRMRAARIKADIEFIQDNGLTLIISGKGI